MPGDKDIAEDGTLTLPGWGDDYWCHCESGIVTVIRATESVPLIYPDGVFVTYQLECQCGCSSEVHTSEVTHEDH